MIMQDTGYGIQDAGAKNAELPRVSHPQSRILHPVLMQRVRWRCRRGLLELDILLERFVDTHYAQLSEAELQTFEVLLDMPDNPLWDMISGKVDATQNEQRALLKKIQSV